LFHIEERKDVLIITDLENKTFKVLPNNAFHRIKYSFFQNGKISLKLNSDIHIEETTEDKVFHIKYFDIEHMTEIEEFSLIGEIIEKALNHNSETAIILISEYVETAISNKIQKDLILYLLGSYSNRLDFSNKDFILVDKVYRVYYDCFRNHQEVFSHTVNNLTLSYCGRQVFKHLCLVRRLNKDFQPTWFNVNGKYYVLTKHGCETISKILFLLESEKHKKDSVFWNQVKHIYQNNIIEKLRGIEE